MSTSIISSLLSLFRMTYVRSAGARVISLTAQFILIYVASRAVNPDMFGEFTTLLSAALFAGVYFAMGQVGATYKVLPTLVKDDLKVEISNEVSRLVSLFIYFMPLLGFSVFISLSVVPNLQKFIPYVICAGAIIAILETLSVILRSYNRIFMSDFFKNSVWRVCFIGLTVASFSLQSQSDSVSLEEILIISLGIGAIFAIILTVSISKPIIRIKTFKEICLKLRSDAQRWLISVLNTIFSSLDVVAVGALVGLAEAGVYFILVRMASIPGLILSITNPVIVPVVSRISQGDKSEDLKNLVKRNTLINVSTTLALCLAVYLARDFVFPILSGYEKDISLVLFLLIFGQMINASVGPTVLASQIFDIQKETVLLILFSFLVFTIGIFGFVPSYGIFAMAVTVVIIRIIQNLGIAILLRFRAGFSIFTGELDSKRFIAQ